MNSIKQALGRWLFVLICCPFAGAYANDVTPVAATPLQTTISASPKAAVRMDPTPRGAILRYLDQGTNVSIIEKSLRTGYSLVQTKDGDQGWVATHNLAHIANAIKAVASFAEQTSADKTAVKQVAALRQPAASVTQSEATTQPLTSAAEPTAAFSSPSTDGYQMQIKNLQQENLALAADNGRAWFVVGSGVFLIGLLVGLFIGRAMKKRTHWG